MRVVPAIAGVGIPAVLHALAAHFGAAAGCGAGAIRRPRRRGEAILVAVIAHRPGVRWTVG